MSSVEAAQSAAGGAAPRGAVAAAVALFTAGGLFWGFLPFFVGLQEKNVGLSATQAGGLGSAYLIGFTLVGLAAPWWIPRVPTRLAVVIGVLLVWAGLGTLGLGTGYVVSFIACVAVGVALGAYWAIAYKVFGATRNAARTFAIALTIGYAALALVTFFIGRLVLPSSGIAGMVIAIGLLVAILSLGAIKLPSLRTAVAATGKSVAGDEKRWTLVTALGAIALFSLAFAAIWAFAGRIGTASGFAQSAVTPVLSSNLLFTGLGSLVVALVGVRIRRWHALIVIYILLAVCMLLLGRVGVFGWFAFAIAGLGFGVGAALPYEMSIVNERDTGGRFVAVIAAMQGLGTALGPITGGAVFESSGITALGFLAVLALVLSFVFLVTADRPLQPRRQRAV